MRLSVIIIPFLLGGLALGQDAADELLGKPKPNAPAAQPSDASPPAGEAPAQPANGAPDSAGAGAGNSANEASDESTHSSDGSSKSDWLDDLMNSGALGHMRRGGTFMWPILVLGILALGVIIERYRSLQILSIDTTALRQQVQDMLESDRVEEAMQLCDREQGPIATVLSAGLRKFLVLRRLNHDPAIIQEQVNKAMEDYSGHIVAALERHLPILATVSSVAPMLGFLGTVDGMIVSFDDIHATLGEKNIVDAAAAGIAVALLTTWLGLVVGIPAYMAYNYFVGVINRKVLDVEESAAELIDSVALKLAMERGG